jgi:hypothetical protein
MTIKERSDGWGGRGHL